MEPSARSITSLTRTGAMLKETRPLSRKLRSRISSSSRVSRWLSSRMMPRKRLAVSLSTSSMSPRISAKERIEVIGVRSSWLTWLRKASFSASTRFSCSFAWRSWAAASSSSRDWRSSRRLASMSCRVSSAMRISPSTETAPRPATWPTSSWAEAAPTAPASSRSRLSMKRSVGSGRPAVLPWARAASANSAWAWSGPRMRAASVSRSSAAALRSISAGAAPDWRKTSTNCAAWNCSSGRGALASDRPTKAATLAAMLQNTAWTSGS